VGLNLDYKAELDNIIRDHLDMEGPLLPVLHAVMARFSYIPKDAIPTVSYIHVRAQETKAKIVRRLLLEKIKTAHITII